MTGLCVDCITGAHGPNAHRKHLPPPSREYTVPAPPSRITAPWTPAQVDALNRFQREGAMHPFTCGAPHVGPAPTLIARVDGWRCPGGRRTACNYRQNWAHAFMADPEAWPKPWQRITARPVDPDMERAATERARQAAEAAERTERCGAGTLGMYGRCLGPCLHPPGHPTDLLHRDVHGAEWGEYNHTAPAPIDPPSDEHTKLEQIRALADELEADPGLGGAYDANMDAVDRIRAILNSGAPATAAAPEICELPHQTIEEQEACEQQRLAEDERDQLVSTLREVLGHFVHKGHPGEPCLSSGWISEKAVARWRAIAYPTKERTP